MKNLKKNKQKHKVSNLILILIIASLALVLSIYDYSNKPVTIGAWEITSLLLDDHEISFANGGIINQNKLKQIEAMEYEKLKTYLNAKNDFCIYVEDENGEIILSKGSPNLNKEKEVCKKK